MTAWRLVADVGGTNVRFAQAIDGALRNVRAAPTSAHRDFYSAMAEYVVETAEAASCAGAAIGATGPVDHGVVKLTNGDWTIDAGAVSAELGARPTSVLNDLEAVAYCAPALGPADLKPVASRPGSPDKPRLIVNVGTGFGAALSVPGPSGWTPVACEPGHMKLAVPNDMASRFSITSPSVEDIVSGQALQTAWGEKGSSTGMPSEFSRLLGQVCGDLVLATGAWGGVYLFGGVARSWSEQAEYEAFLAAFDDKGPMAHRMRSVPVNQIIDEHAALRGLALAPLP